ESDRDGYRVVIELKRDAMADVVLNQLYRFTPLQTNFAANVLALDSGRPQVMNLKDLLRLFIAFREQVVTRRTKFLLNKARDRAHVLVGLAIAVANIDEMIRVIRTSPDPNTARETMMSRDWLGKDVEAMITLIDDPRHRLAEDGTARLSLEQAKAILDLRLQRLTALGREEISEELDKLAVEIADYLEILRSRARVQAIVKTELSDVKAEFATPRKTVIIEQEGEVEDEDLIQREDMVVTVSHAGYVKRVPLSTYRAQRRGGKGRAGMQLGEGEAIVDVQICTERDDVLLTAAGGQCIRFPVTDVRVFTGRTSMGVRGIALPGSDKLISLSILRHVEATSDERSAYLKMRRAVAGETAAEEAAETEGEEAVGAIQLTPDRYVEMSAQEQVVLTVSVNGYGKRTSSYEYRTT